MSISRLAWPVILLALSVACTGAPEHGQKYGQHGQYGQTRVSAPESAPAPAPGSALAPHSVAQDDHLAPAVPGAEPTDAAPSSPPRLMVPKLGLDEAIVPVPIVSGTWDLTQLDTQVGLLTTTGRWPGDDWAMALVGHVTVSAAQRGPFADLWKARLNDEVIYRWQGVDYVYAVSEKTNAQPDEVDRLYIPDGDGLVLVTCTDWDYLHFTYAQRLIVRATLVRREALP